ncbi:MAG TPA: response regulator [Bacteroidia bacterium]|nr:response regulator [Bacteroidia bacterium]
MLKNRKILLVDDDEDDQELFTEVLRAIEPSLQFAMAGNGAEALQKLSVETPLPSFILMDINMPKMNGLECLSILKNDEKYKDIPVVMLTTSTDPPSARQALKLGATRFLTKAASLFDIRSQLREVLTKDFIIHF